MRSDEVPTSTLSATGGMMMVFGSLFAVVFDDLAWLFIAVAVAGLAMNLWLLSAQWRAERR